MNEENHNSRIHIHVLHSKNETLPMYSCNVIILYRVNTDLK